MCSAVVVVCLFAVVVFVSEEVLSGTEIGPCWRLEKDRQTNREVGGSLHKPTL